MIDALGLVLREGLGLAIVSVLPLFAVAAITAVVLGILLGALGIRDAALGQIARSLAVIAALVAIAASLADSTLAFAERSWSLDPAGAESRE